MNIIHPAKTKKTTTTKKTGKESAISLKAVVIDNDQNALNVMRHILERRGYDVKTYDDPVQSPMYIRKSCPCSMNEEGCPDLIISNYSMKGVNGAELLEWRYW